MKNRLLLQLLGMLAALACGSQIGLSQQPPDMILYNGKIVTVDNDEVNANLGATAQAIAIQGDKILAVGTNTQVRGLAGTNTKSIDLQGKMVIPGMSGTHDHPMDWDPLNPLIVQKVVNDSMHIERFLNVAPDEVLKQFPQVLNEAVQKAKLGQWIRISLLYGKEYRWGDQISGYLGRQITKQMLDMAAPNNPTIVRGGFTGILMNQKAIEETEKHYGAEWEKFVRKPLGEGIYKTGTGGTEYRWVEQDVLYPPAALAEIYRLGLSWFGGYGMTMNASRIYTPGGIAAYSTLDRNKQMAIRLPWAWFWPQRNDFFSDPYFLASTVSREGTGSDHFWFMGAVPSQGNDCTTLPGTSPEVKQREPECNYRPGGYYRQVLYNYIKAGGRFAGAHTGGDGDIDHILDIIEQASKDGGMTLDQIRAKRHAYDHMAMNPRPDQIQRVKKLGMHLSGWDLFVWEGGGYQVLQDYGEQASQWVVPRKSLIDAGVTNSVEIDRPIGYTNLSFFSVLHVGITRKDLNGRIISPQQAISREAMLKAATLWGAVYAMREDKLGSIKTGKLADLAVLDRDYLTIPVDDIPNIRALMTIVGGKIVHLVPSMARAIGMQPMGSQVELGGPAAQY